MDEVIDHINRVVEGSLRLYDMWEEMGCDMTTFTKEELVFSAINHDLGKIYGKDVRGFCSGMNAFRYFSLAISYKPS